MALKLDIRLQFTEAVEVDYFKSQKRRKKSQYYNTALIICHKKLNGSLNKISLNKWQYNI